MNSNSMPSTFWYFYDVLRNAEIFKRVLPEINACISNSSTVERPVFDVTKLCSRPLLQSIYAETLRMRIAVYIIRRAEFQETHCQNYILPRNKMVVISSHTAHMDKQNWSNGPGKSHPPEEFWADRFLVDPKELEASSVGPTDVLPSVDKSERGAKFSLNGLAGAWIPFGGGIHQCPGRHWVKLQMILSFAMVCMAFDIELEEKESMLEPGMSKFGLGALPPKTKVAFRIRRRAA